MIKYLGSKRTLVPLLGHLAVAAEAHTALDLFSGTTRVARALKQQGMFVTAVDTASYTEVFAKTWIELDSTDFDFEGFEAALVELNQLAPVAGYFTQKFCIESRFFQPHNGEKIDAIREAIQDRYLGTELYYPLLTSLILAADRVDSTTGVQMAFLKSWSPRSFKSLELKDPEFIAGTGRAIRGDALEVIETLEPVDLAYLDPPYNQHRYFGNYHIWETLVRWDKPETYGVANKRIDTRDQENKSVFNSRPLMPAAIEKVVLETKAKNLILSFNNEAWLSLEQLVKLCENRGAVKTLDIDFKRYVGAKIGVFNKQGERVGSPGRGRNLEHLIICGEPDSVEKMFQAGLKFA